MQILFVLARVRYNRQRGQKGKLEEKASTQPEQSGQSWQGPANTLLIPSKAIRAKKPVPVSRGNNGKRSYTLAWALLAFGLVCTIAGGIAFWQIRGMNWIVVPGKVIAVQESPCWIDVGETGREYHSNCRAAVILYTSDENRNFTFTTELRYYPPFYSIGDTVRVYYLVNQPATPYLRPTEGRQGILLILLPFGLGGMIAGILAWLITKRANYRGKNTLVSSPGS